MKAGHDFAATKHKGLPQHVRESILESVNFKKMMDETSTSLDEMLECLNKDMNDYKLTGNMSDRLRDFMHLHHHAKKQMEETNVPPVAPVVPANPHPVGSSLPANQIPGKEDLLKGKGRGYYEEESGLEEELNELARLAGIKVADEGNAFTGKLASTPKGGKFELDGKEFTDTSTLDEEPNEGNEFSGARQDAIDSGKKEFEVGGETYPVKEAKEKVLKNFEKLYKDGVERIETFFANSDPQD